MTVNQVAVGSNPTPGVERVERRREMKTKVASLFKAIFSIPSQEDNAPMCGSIPHAGITPLDPADFITYKPASPRDLYESRVRGNARKSRK